MGRYIALLFAVLMVFSGNSFAGTNTLLPKIKALSLDELVLDRSNRPVTVIETPPILNSKGEIAQGMTEIILTLDSSAKNELIIQGKTLRPGESLSIAQDLSATGGALKIPAYPSQSNVVGSSQYVIDIPKVTAKLCADDFTHDSETNTCLKVNTTNLSYVCPDLGWRITGDLRNCTQQTTIAKESCPTGFSSNHNGTCTKLEFQSTIPKCSTGFAYSTINNRCEKTLNEQAGKTCSDTSYSYQSNTNDCRKLITQAVSYDCGTGYSYNSTIKKCERTLSAVASKICPSGYAYKSNSNRCEKVVSTGAAPICASGYSYSTTNRRCEKTLTQNASKVCSAGYAYIPARNRCEKTTTATAGKVCSSGYAFRNNRCEKTTTTTASKVCSSGYTFKNNRCEKTLTQGASKVCGAGYSYISTRNRCEKTTTSTASKVCSTGYAFRNNRCEKTVTQARNVVYSCSPRTESYAHVVLVGDKCHTTYSGQYANYCTVPGCLEITNANQSSSCPSGFSSSGSSCSKLVTTAFSFSCPSGYSRSGTTCSKLNAAAFSYSCPSGYSRSGSSCSKLQTTGFSYSCPSGYSRSGSSCSKLLTTAFSYNCPNGYSRSGSLCSKLQTAAFSYSCPNDYTKSGSSCSKLVANSNTWSCPSGYTRSGSTCSKTLSNNFSYRCPTNYQLGSNGSCSRYQSKGYSLSCDNNTFTANIGTEICEKTLTATHINKCNDPRYTLAGSSCSLLLDEKETWVCSDSDYFKTSETNCRKQTDTNLAGNCPAGYVKNGTECEINSTIAKLESCPASYTRHGDVCQRNVSKLPMCDGGLFDNSCSCPSGYSLNETSKKCESTEQVDLVKTCPAGYSGEGDSCDYTNSVKVVYDTCPVGMTNQNGNCVLSVSIAATPICNAPYSISSETCQYTDVRPAGYEGGGVEQKSFEGEYITERSSVKLATTEFTAIVGEVNELALDVTGGCVLVEDEEAAKGEITKGNIPCAVIWQSLPSGLEGEGNKLTGIFDDAGELKISYQLKGFNGIDKSPIVIVEDEIIVNVSMPMQPEVTDISTRMMNKVITGLSVYNYDANSKLNLTTVIVEPKKYEQVIDIETVGTCNVEIDGTSCNIYSDITFERKEEKLTFDSVYKVWGNSQVGGWKRDQLTAKDWTVHHDFRGPKIEFTEFNGNRENSSIVNHDLGFDVMVIGGDGAVGIKNFRPELAAGERWWQPQKVELEFVPKEGGRSVNVINVENVNVRFDVPNASSEIQELQNYIVIENELGNAYPFSMNDLNPGDYVVNVTAKDNFGNGSVTVVENINVATPEPQIKLINKKRVINVNNTPSFEMLEDVIVVAHNGFEGDAKITSIKIDGRDAVTTNSDGHYKALSGNGFSLEANTSHNMVITAEDSKGQTAELTVAFDYLKMLFGFQRKPQTVIQLVEDVNLTVNRKRGLRCDLYGTKAAAALAANDRNHACYVEWTALPDGLRVETATYQAKATGGVKDLGQNRAAFTAYIVNRHGKANEVISDEVIFDAIPPKPISLALDDRLKLANGVYKVSVNDRLIGRYQGSSSRANVDVKLTNQSGDTKLYKHNQLPFGETQNFSAYASRLGESKLWDRIPYKLKAAYRLAPELSKEVDFDLIVTPHPYMQVLMDLDSPRYASTDKINATIRLGIKNNLTNTFDYNVDTMGSSWDVYIAFKKGKAFEPITATTQIGGDGTAVVEVDADIVFNRNEAVYAVAKARSPYPEISIQRVSIPRSITVVKGTSVEGKIVTRTVHSRIPAAFDLRFDTKSFQDFFVMGEIKWQSKAGNNWVDMDGLTGKRYVSVKSKLPETIDIRAVIKNKVTGAITETETIRLISYDVPKINIEGLAQAISGQAVKLSAIDGNSDTQTGTIVEWSLDGKTWMNGSDKFIVNVKDSNLRVHGRMKYVNTANEVSGNYWSTASKYISVIKPRPITLNIAKPNMVEVGTDVELRVMISNSFARTGVPLKIEWTYPDGQVVKDVSEITHELLESDLDVSNRVTFVAKVWLEGFKDTTLGEANAVMNTFKYSFPSMSDLSLIINNNVKFVPSSGYAVVNMPIINAPGVKFTYDWTFDKDAIEKVQTSGKGMYFKVIKAGVHRVSATVSDNRGNFETLMDFVDAQQPNALEFKVNEIYSNKHMRAPLNAAYYPNVKVGHPYDFAKEYTWTINGVTGEVSNRAIGVFNSLSVGHYDIELAIKTNFGQTGSSSFSIDVLENQIPVCEPSVRKQYGVSIVDANCKDEDGRISFYSWTVNGTVFSPYGRQVRFNDNDYPNGATVLIEAVDDAGGVGIVNLNF